LPDGDADLDDLDFSGFVVPPRASCGGVLKLDVVFFSEQLRGCIVVPARKARCRVLMGQSRLRAQPAEQGLRKRRLQLAEEVAAGALPPSATRALRSAPGRRSRASRPIIALRQVDEKTDSFSSAMDSLSAAIRTGGDIQIGKYDIRIRYIMEYFYM
jgi:hypothetical protein